MRLSRNPGTIVLAEMKAAPKKRARGRPAGQAALQPLRIVPQPPEAPALAQEPQALSRRARNLIAAAFLAAFAVLAALVLVAAEVGRIRDELDGQRTEQAWTALKQRVGGNTGKAAALSHLWTVGQSLDGLDLSCRRIGDFDAIRSRCEGAPRFIGLALDYATRQRAPVSGLSSAASLEGPGIRSLDLSGTVIERARITSMWLTRSKFDRLRLSDSVVAGTRLEGSFRRARIVNSVLTDSWIEGDTRGLRIERSDVSGLTFVGSGAAKTAPELRDVWAWADMPPSQMRADGKGEEELRPLDEDRLRSVRLCMPPLAAGGAVVPVEDRRYAADQNQDCQMMSLVASQFLFPQAYGTGGQRSWSDRLPVPSIAQGTMQAGR